jgi:hypothetical protein
VEHRHRHERAERDLAQRVAAERDQRVVEHEEAAEQRRHPPARADPLGDPVGVADDDRAEQRVDDPDRGEVVLAEQVLDPGDQEVRPVGEERVVLDRRAELLEHLVGA